MLTVGVGWSKIEYTLAGQDFHTRGRRTDEMITILRKLWSGEMVEHEGRDYAFPRLEMNPTPPAPIPSSSISKGMNPQPPLLADAAKQWRTNQLFWIIKNGVKMTGMPAFGLYA